jgi:hypothetical protein
MFLLLNKDKVIIDTVETVKPVRKSSTGLTILCSMPDAQGYIGADEETIYAKMGTQLIEAYTNIASVVEYDGEATPLAEKYVDGEIVPNEAPFPLGNMALTSAAEKTSADLEYVAMMTGVDI